MSPRRIARFLGAVVVIAWAVLLGAAVPSASAQPCPDVEVVFARGTAEPPGVGGIGQGFVDSLRSQVGARSVGMYAVNYPASSDFGSGIDFARTVVDGIRDAGAHVQSMAANCPNTRMVLGGYRRARPWRVSSPRRRCRRKYLPRSCRTYPSRWRLRWRTMSPQWSCSGSLRMSSCASSARRLSLSARRMRPRRSSCAPR